MNDALYGLLLVSVMLNYYFAMCTSTSIPNENFYSQHILYSIPGECDANRSNMLKYCRKACNLCNGDAEEDDDDDEVEDDDDDNEEVVEAAKPDVKCKDTHKLCKFWADSGECQKNPTFMETGCPRSCSTCDKVKKQTRKLVVNDVLPSSVDKEVANQIMEKSKEFGFRQIAAGKDAKATLVVIEESAQYMKDEKTLALPKDILDNCSNKHEMCSFWAAVNECENNRAYMTVNCSPACKSCNMIDINARCPPLENAEPALRPGDLQKVRILLVGPSVE